VKATQFEFRFRLWIAFAIYVVGFWAPWLRYDRAAAPVSTTWLVLSGELARWLPLETASIVVTVAAILLAILGTIFRIWGTAYIGGAVVKSSTMHARGVVAAGPYRYLRNPLYLGSFLFAVSVTILMPPSGAIFSIVASFVQMLRLILREEAYMEAQQGETYLTYKLCVPRFFPSLVARAPQSTEKAQWLQAIVVEIFYVAMTGCFLALAWRYNANLLTQALLICFGLSLVTRAFVMNEA
jgi:protein-S-isoprenylcysteine O-methyltransferase Ste14